MGDEVTESTEMVKTSIENMGTYMVSNKLIKDVRITIQKNGNKKW